ncbi:MAG: thiamine diphosphokinase [Ignavibacteria bacterium]|nr:thiamine diphosphokinase [Ignavibacteria bacterium]
MKKCLIIGNGKAPEKKTILFLMKKGFDTIICADGGLNHAHKLKIIPHYIIGDFDSVDKRLLESYRDKSNIIQIKRQDDTDIEKCLKYAVKQKFSEAVLLSVTGDRLDHSFCNLGIALKFHDKINVRVISETSLLTVYEKQVSFAAKNGEYISLYAFDNKTKITSQGLKYPLRETRLPFGVRESTSNVAVKEEVKLNIKNGRIFVIRDFETMEKNDLFS